MEMHHDRKFAAEIMQYIDYGVPTFFEGPNLNQVYKNWKSSKVLSADVLQQISNDVLLGRKIGPFYRPPTPLFVGSPMGAILKLSEKGRKVRIITDLSWPPTKAVNFFIPAEKCTLSYVSIDDAVNTCIRIGRGAQLSKLDLADAYRNLVVDPSEWYLLGTTWQKDECNTEFYLDTRLPFGLRSAAKQFDKFACGLQYIMECNGVENVFHYLDDFLCISNNDKDFARTQKETMITACDMSGLPVNFKKVHGPTTCIEFLGIMINTETMTLSMSAERLDNVKKELSFWRGKNQGTKRQLLSLLGKLVFLGRVIKPGRIFLRRLFNATMNLKHLHFKLKLNAETKKDIIWWSNYIDSWNSLTFFHDMHWIDSNELFFATDASDIGLSAVLQTAWAFSTLSPYQRAQSIAWRELYALVAACATWSSRLCGKKLHILCDNMSIVYSVNNGTSKNCDIMKLIRALHFIAAKNSFEVKLIYIPSKENVAADLLSRLAIDKFKYLFPFMDTHPTQLSSDWLSVHSE